MIEDYLLSSMGNVLNLSMENSVLTNLSKWVIRPEDLQITLPEGRQIASLCGNQLFQESTYEIIAQTILVMNG